jgi:hypothetical protein
MTRAAPERSQTQTVWHTMSTRTSTSPLSRNKTQPTENTSVTNDPHCRRPAHCQRWASSGGWMPTMSRVGILRVTPCRHQPSEPPAVQDTHRNANSDLRPCMGKGAITSAGQHFRATWQAEAPQTPVPLTQPLTIRPPPTTTGCREGSCPRDRVKGQEGAIR